MLGLWSVLLACTGSSDDADAKEDAATATLDSDGGDETLDKGVAHAFFAVHHDPGGSVDPVVGGPTTLRAETYFPDMVELVELADEGGHKLTLMYTAQWAHYVTSPDCALPPSAAGPGKYEYGGTLATSCLELVRAIEANGHEIAMHHHPLDAPAAWDGYSNDPAAATADEYLGDLHDLMDEVGAVAAGGTDAVRSATTEEFPIGGGSFEFTAARGPTPYESSSIRGDLASQPCAWQEDHHWVWRFRMRSFTTTDVQTEALGELDAAMADLAGTGPWAVGFVTHVKDFDDSGHTNYEALFSALTDAGLAMEGLATLAPHFEWTAGDPSADVLHACPADEALEARR